MKSMGCSNAALFLFRSKELSPPRQGRERTVEHIHSVQLGASMMDSSVYERGVVFSPFIEQLQDIFTPIVNKYVQKTRMSLRIGESSNLPKKQAAKPPDK